MKRISIDIETMRRWVNRRLASPDTTLDLPSGITPQQAYRLGVASLYEQAAMCTGNFAGYMETDRSDGRDSSRRFYLPTHGGPLGVAAQRVTTGSCQDA